MLLARSQGNVFLLKRSPARAICSRSYFIRAFRETTQRTPHQWLLERRVDQARELLKRSDRSLSDIAMACGFSDQSHFTRTFSQLVGTPLDIGVDRLGVKARQAPHVTRHAARNAPPA